MLKGRSGTFMTLSSARAFFEHLLKEGGEPEMLIEFTVKDEDGETHKSAELHPSESTVNEAARRYLAIALQHHFRHSTGTYGQVETCGEVIKYKED